MDQQREEQFKVVVRLADGTEYIWLFNNFENGEGEPYSWASPSCNMKDLVASSTKKSRYSK